MLLQDRTPRDLDGARKALSEFVDALRAIEEEWGDGSELEALPEGASKQIPG